jgi:hypothetical protein
MRLLFALALLLVGFMPASIHAGAQTTRRFPDAPKLPPGADCEALGSYIPGLKDSVLTTITDYLNSGALDVAEINRGLQRWETQVCGHLAPTLMSMTAELSFVVCANFDRDSDIECALTPPFFHADLRLLADKRDGRYALSDWPTNDRYGFNRARIWFFEDVNNDRLPELGFAMESSGNNMTTVHVEIVQPFRGKMRTLFETSYANTTLARIKRAGGDEFKLYGGVGRLLVYSPPGRRATRTYRLIGTQVFFTETVDPADSAHPYYRLVDGIAAFRRADTELAEDLLKRALSPRAQTREHPESVANPHGLHRIQSVARFQLGLLYLKTGRKVQFDAQMNEARQDIGDGHKWLNNLMILRAQGKSLTEACRITGLMARSDLSGFYIGESGQSPVHEGGEALCTALRR